MVKQPTEKQLAYIHRIQKKLGEDTVSAYMGHLKMPNEISRLSRAQAQKIITGLSPRMPKPILSNVYMWPNAGPIIRPFSDYD